MEIYGDVNIFGDNSQIHVNYDLDYDKRYNGFLCYDYVSSDVEYGDILYLDLTKNIWSKACANDINTLPARGVACKEYLGPNQKVPILLMGFMLIEFYSTINKTQLWVSDTIPGKIVDTIPTAIGNYCQSIGFARSENIFYFDFCPFYIQIG